MGRFSLISVMQKKLLKKFSTYLSLKLLATRMERNFSYLVNFKYLTHQHASYISGYSLHHNG